jgi:nucleotide-binding universal stress UspA family protein
MKLWGTIVILSSSGPTAVTVAYDASPCSSAALEWALAVLSGWRAPVSLAVVTVSVPRSRPRNELGGLAAAELARVLARRDEQLASYAGRRSGLVGIAAESVEGEVVATLLDHTEDTGLLALGRHSRQGPTPGPALGAASRACLRESRCPIALVGPQVRPAAPQRLVLSDAECSRDPLLRAWAEAWAEQRGFDLALFESVGPASAQALVDDILVVGRASGAVPTLLFRTTPSPVVVVPTDLMARADLAVSC